MDRAPVQPGDLGPFTAFAHGVVVHRKLTPAEFRALASDLAVRERLRSLIADLQRCRDDRAHAGHLAGQMQAAINRSVIVEVWADPRGWAYLALDALIADTNRHLAQIDARLAPYVEVRDDDV